MIARLQPLAGNEVYDYMAHRLNEAGGGIKLFAPEAIAAITAASGGTPRNVNTICFNSLSLAYALGNRQVGCEEVAEALRDLDLSFEAPAFAPPATPVPTAPLASVTATSTLPPRDPATVEWNAARDSILSFQPVRRSYRHVMISGSVVLLATGAMIWRTLAG